MKEGALEEELKQEAGGAGLSPGVTVLQVLGGHRPVP